MSSPFGNLVPLIREGAKSPLAVLSLMILLCACIIIILFKDAGEIVRLLAFIAALVAFGAFVWAVGRLLTENGKPGIVSEIASPSSVVFTVAGVEVKVPDGLDRAPVRCSLSALVRIEIEGEFLLVRGHRIKHQFQPVGGVYKRYPSASTELRRLGVLNDDKLPIDSDSVNDLRVRVPANNLPKFFVWYESRKGRENSPWREFYEELVSENFLNSKSFPYISCSFERTHVEWIKWSEHHNCHEILVADIFELHPTPKQLSELKRMREAQNSEYRWVTAEQIHQRGINQFGGVASISPTASWIL